MELSDTDFRPRNPVGFAVLFGLLYGLLFGSAMAMGVKSVLGAASPAWTRYLEAAFIVCGYLLGAAFLLFYVVFSPYRFAFTEEGLSVLTWRGRRFVPWAEVQKASLSSYKGNVDLVLHAGGLRYITVPLNAFRSSAGLLAAIQRRLPVGVAAAERQLSMIRDD